MSIDNPDFVAVFEERHKRLDFVEAIYDNPHARTCSNYVPNLDSKGHVYCGIYKVNKDTGHEYPAGGCCQMVGSISDLSDAFCPDCGCPKSDHNFYPQEEWKCGSCGRKGCGL